MAEVETRRYHPYLVAASTPAYCAGQQWIAVKDEAGIDHIYYVSRVERLWKDESGKSTRCTDGSWRRFEPETSKTNGLNPCLLYIDGEPHPWYFPSGHTYVRTVYFGRHGDGD